MVPLMLLVAGLIALGVAAAILRSFGPGYRLGRLLAVAPRVSVAEAHQIAEAGNPRYVRIDGRIDSDAEFEDDAHRPLVLRRTTIAWRPAHGRGPWTTFDTRLEAVPFVISEGLDEIAVDGQAIADGLIITPRESIGQARDVDALIEAGVAPDAQARLRVDQVSTIEHGTVLGVPARGPDGRVSIGPGLGRPLIISTLESGEAMRTLSGGATRRSRVAAACLVASFALIAAAAVWWFVDALIGGGVATAVAASPPPTMRPGSDTRTSGAGPGLVGDPLLALAGVLSVAAMSLIASLAYVRFTRAATKVLQVPGEHRDRPR